MSTITRITTKPFELAMRGTLRWGAGSSLAHLRHVLVSLELGECQAIAEAPVRPTIYGETVSSIEAIIAEVLAPQLLGLDVNDRVAIGAVLDSIPNNHTAKGALDMAITEGRACTEGSSLFARYADPEKRLPVSYILGIAEQETMLAETKAVMEAGVNVFKVKVGRDAQHDTAIIRTLVAEFGDSIKLYADANELLDPATVASDLERLAGLGLLYIEEPLPRRLLKERAQLKALGILPIIADDSCFDLEELQRELDFDTFDILNIKPARTGFSESSRMLALAKTAGKGVMVGSQASSGLGTLHAAIFASQEGVDYPCELSFPLRLSDDPIGQQLHYQQGYLAVQNLAAISIAIFNSIELPAEGI